MEKIFQSQIEGSDYSLDENKLVSCAHALPVLAGKIVFAFFQWALIFDFDPN